MALVLILLHDDPKGDGGVNISATSEPAFENGKLTQAQAVGLHMIELSRAIGEKKAFHITAEGKALDVEKEIAKAEHAIKSKLGQLAKAGQVTKIKDVPRETPAFERTPGREPLPPRGNEEGSNGDV